MLARVGLEVRGVGVGYRAKKWRHGRRQRVPLPGGGVRYPVRCMGRVVAGVEALRNGAVSTAGVVEVRSRTVPGGWTRFADQVTPRGRGKDSVRGDGRWGMNWAGFSARTGQRGPAPPASRLHDGHVGRRSICSSPTRFGSRRTRPCPTTVLVPRRRPSAPRAASRPAAMLSEWVTDVTFCPGGAAFG